MHGQVNNCNVDGAVRLRADDSDEERVSQVATVLDNYVLQPNVTDACTLDPKCIVPGQSFTVGIGVSETQVRGLQRCTSFIPPSCTRRLEPLFPFRAVCVLTVHQVVVNSIAGSAGIQWTSVTSVVFSTYIRIVSVWHALVYSFAVGVVVAVSVGLNLAQLALFFADREV